jgi:hypothetical protein
MSVSGSLIGGTFAFIALGFATAVALFFLYRMKKLNKDEVRRWRLCGIGQGRNASKLDSAPSRRANSAC